MNKQIKCHHKYEAFVMPLGGWILGIPYWFECRYCFKVIYGNQRTADKLDRKGQRYTYEGEWKGKLDAFQKDPVMNMYPPIILPDCKKEGFWPL